MEEKAKRRFKKRGCCGCLFGFTLFVGLILFGFGIWIDESFSGRSNLIYLQFRDSDNDLMVKTSLNEWKTLDQLDQSKVESSLDRGEQVAGVGIRWRSLTVKRPARSKREGILNAFVASKVNVIEFDPDQFEFFPWFERIGGSFESLTYSDALASEDAGESTRFAINLNYYGRDGQPLGWIVRDEAQIRKQWKSWSGFFFVKGGQTKFGPRSLLDETSGVLTQATQGYPSVMKGGRVWDYVSNNQDQFFNGSELTFRSLAGVGEDGRIVLVISGRGGLLNMGEVTEIARLVGVKDATLLDGGRALQYGLRGPEGNESFHSFNNTILNRFVPGELLPERPPVFLVVKRKAEGGD